MEVGSILFADSVIEEPMEAARLRNQLMETLSCLARITILEAPMPSFPARDASDFNFIFN